MTSYIYCFVREDISPEQKIVQIGHACYEAGKLYKDNVGVSSLILLSAKNEEDLKDIRKSIDIRGINSYMFFEPDFGMGYSAICTEPVLDKTLQSFFRRWELYRHTA